MKARNLILSESQHKMRVGDQEFEVLCFPHSGGRHLCIAYLPDGRQIASAPSDTSMTAQMDLHAKLREMFAPRFDPNKQY